MTSRCTSTDAPELSASSDPTDRPDAPARLLAPDELADLCRTAVRAAGGSPAVADSLAAATVAAERRGKAAIGVRHLTDYLDGLRSGRIAADARPAVTRPRAGIVVVDAAGGPAQLAFDVAEDQIIEAARDAGIALLTVRSAFTAGELGDYATRLAQHGLIAITGANSPALMSVHEAKEEVTGTNPLAFALPHPEGPRMFDQAASETAWVKVRDAARAGESIPQGWALDCEGRPTNDAGAALAGALLPFGGIKGGNIAMMIEMLAALAGGAFSLDAAPFDTGSVSPSLGMFAIAIDPTAIDPDYPQRAEDHLERLHREHGVDFGRRKPDRTRIEIPEDLHRELVDAGSWTGTGSHEAGRPRESTERGAGGGQA